jgi:hypothetical protein
MEKERARLLSRPDGESGIALVVVLVAIVILLPTTLVLMRFVFQRQQQSMDFRDMTALEFAAEAGFERARLSVADERNGLSPFEGRSQVLSDYPELHVATRVERQQDIVLTQTGTVVEGIRAGEADLSQTGVDAEGRLVYQNRLLEIYLIRVEVRKRASLAGVRRRGVVARLPDGTLQTLGASSTRMFLEDPSR